MVAVGVVGCGGSRDLSGDIVVRGSTTVLPIVSNVADGFARRNPLVTFDVDMVGSQEGIADLCAGLVPVAGSSRPLTRDERRNCRSSGVEVATLKVAHDAVVLLSRTDPPVTCLTLEQIYAAAGPDARGVDTWSEVAAASGTPTVTLPAGPFVLVGPGSASGTVAVFQAEALGPVAEQRGTTPVVRDDYVSVAAEQAIRNALAVRPGALGFVGYTTAAPWFDDLRPVAVDGGSGCARPVPANLRDHSYPLTRDLYLVVDLGVARREQQVEAFVSTFLGPAGRSAAVRAESVPLSTAEATRESERWRSLVDGSGA